MLLCEATATFKCELPLYSCFSVSDLFDILNIFLFWPQQAYFSKFQLDTLFYIFYRQVFWWSSRCSLIVKFQCNNNRICCFLQHAKRWSTAICCKWTVCSLIVTNLVVLGHIFFYCIPKSYFVSIAMLGCSSCCIVDFLDVCCAKRVVEVLVNSRLHFLCAGTTAAGSITENIGCGLCGLPTWSLSSRRMHMREGLTFVLIQTHGRQSAKYGYHNAALNSYY